MNIYLKLPDKDDVDKFIKYYEIVKEYNPNVKPLANRENFDEYIKGINKRINGIEDGIYIYDYYLIEDDEIIGLCCLIINPEDNQELYSYIGNISYVIRPDKRNQGYGSLCLHLLIKKAKEFGLKSLTVCCTEDNIGSRKIIENNSGELKTKNVNNDKTDTDMINYGKINLKYIIDIDQSLEKFKGNKK